jgi:hypothetical protein
VCRSAAANNLHNQDAVPQGKLEQHQSTLTLFSYWLRMPLNLQQYFARRNILTNICEKLCTLHKGEARSEPEQSDGNPNKKSRFLHHAESTNAIMKNSRQVYLQP